MVQDFRTVAEAVKRQVKELDAQDPNYKWKATVTKAEVRIYWSYLEFKGNIPPFIITTGSADREECNEGDDTFIVLRDEHNVYMDGRIIGSEVWADGNFEFCVLSLMRELQRKVNNEY